MSLMLDILETYKMQGFAHKVRLNDILVIGYSVAGKPEVALQVFGRIRFKGMDLDAFAYHVLLNALVEESCFDVDEFHNQLEHCTGLEILLVDMSRRRSMDHLQVSHAFFKEKNVLEFWL